MTSLNVASPQFEMVVGEKPAPDRDHGEPILEIQVLVIENSTQSLFFRLLSVLAAILLLSGIGIAFSYSLYAGSITLLVVVLNLPILLVMMFKVWPHTPLGRRILLGKMRRKEVLPRPEHDADIKSLAGQRKDDNKSTTFRFECVDSIEKGIQRLEESAFDVVLLDVELSDSSGLNPFSRLYARHPDVPVVILTGIDKEQVDADALHKGAQDFLVKSKLSRDVLYRSLRFAIERNRRQQAERTILRTQLEERRRLARDLHDGVIQSLSAMRLRLQILDDELSPTSDPQTATTIRELATEALTAIHDVRLLSHDLHPSQLDGQELPEAIGSYGKQLQRQYGLAIDFTNHCTQSLGSHIKHHLYRIVQEAMCNAAKHANANRVQVLIREQDFFIIVEVHDDGIGFDEPKNGSSRKGLGLTSMRERARLLGGTARVQSQPGSGTNVLVKIPV